MLQQQQNLGQNVGTSKIHLSPPVVLAAVRSKSMVLLLLIRCWLLLPLWDSLIVLCFVMRYFVFILVLQSFWWNEWVGCFALFNFLVSCDCCVALPHGFVCSLWLWYFLIILTFCKQLGPRSGVKKQFDTETFLSQQTTIKSWEVTQLAKK